MPPGTHVAMTGDAGALLEREDELDVLHALVQQAGRGSGGVAVVTGPPGAGKTALLNAVRAAGRSSGLRDLYARGRELERDIAFGVAVGLLGPPVRAVPRPDRRRLLAGLAGLPAALLDAVEPGHTGEQGSAALAPEQLVLGLYWLAATLCCPDENSGRVVPLLVTVDDAHWSDAGSLQFLCHLADNVDELPIAMVVGTRSDSSAAQQSWLHRLATLPHSTVLTAGPLSDEGVASLVKRLLPGARPSLASACARASGGNPFLLVELARSMAAAGPQRAEAADIADIVPDAVLRSVLARLGRLPASARQLAEAVAVLGDDAPLARAAELCGTDVAAAGEAADRLAAEYLLRPGAPLAFTHPLIASAVHAELPRFARSRAHRRAAELLAADAEPPDSVGGHLMLTEPEGDQRIIAMLTAAAGRASERGDGAAAARFLQRALAEPPSRVQRPALLTELASAQLRAGHQDAAQTCREALSLPGGLAVRARAHDVLAQILNAQGEIERAAVHSAQALRLLGEGSPAWQDLLARHLTTAAFDPRRVPEVRSWLDPIVAEASRGRPPAHPGLRTHLALHLALRGAAAHEVAGLAVTPHGAAPVVAETNGTLAGLLVHALVIVDELAAAEKIADEAVRLAQAQGAVIAYANASYHRALCRYPRGALAEAWADLEQVRAVRPMAGPGAAGWIGGLLVQLALDMGDLAAARAGLRLAQRAPEESMERAVCLAASARLLLLDGKPEAALSAATEAGRALKENFSIDHPGLVSWRPVAALAAHAAGRIDDARQLASTAVDQAETTGLARPLGVALHAAGLVAPARLSLALLTRAVAVLEDSPASLEHTRALVSLGAALRRASRLEDARAFLRRGLSQADAMGCRPLAERARSELLASGARPRRAAVTGQDALTPTERRVADLAASGHTNRQIAQALFITAKTVETHMTHIYRKLQVPDRSHLAAAQTGESPGR